MLNKISNRYLQIGQKKKNKKNKKTKQKKLNEIECIYFFDSDNKLSSKISISFVSLIFCFIIFFRLY